MDFGVLCRSISHGCEIHHEADEEGYKRISFPFLHSQSFLMYLHPSLHPSVHLSLSPSCLLIILLILDAVLSKIGSDIYFPIDD